MSLDNHTPLGLRITHFILLNLLWYITFSFIFSSLNPFEWWLFINPWGRVIIIFMELSFIGNTFLEK